MFAGASQRSAIPPPVRGSSETNSTRPNRPDEDRLGGFLSVSPSRERSPELRASFARARTHAPLHRAARADKASQHRAMEQRWASQPSRHLAERAGQV